MVGIRGLEPYMRERQLTGHASLEALRGVRLGIDATHYINTLLSDPTSREPLVASTGGLPLALGQRIENDIRHWERYGIKAIFILAGLPLASRPPPKGFDHHPDRETKVKEEAWSFYENGEVERAVMTLASVRGGAWTDHRDVLRLVIRQLRHRFVEYIVAPYLEYAQLAYLLRHPKGYIHAIYSSSECLLFPVDRVITSIDFTNSSFTFVDKSRLIRDLDISDDQFLDACILAGTSLSRTFPLLNSDFSFRAAVDIIKEYKSGVNVSQRAGPPYGEAFMRARLAVKYSLVLTTEGNVCPIPLVLSIVADIPPNIDEIFSPRLPDELYFHLCRAFVSPQVLGWLTSGMIVETQPLADSPEYRRFIKDVITEGHTSPRCTSLALLAESLHPLWKRRLVSAHYYFDTSYTHPDGVPIPFADVLTHNLVEKCNWVIPSSLVSTELLRQNSSHIDIKLCLAALRSSLPTESRPIERKDEVIANIVFRFLDVRGFINPDRTRNVMGKAMHAGCANTRVNDRFQEALYLLLELLRAGVVHGSRFGNEILSGGPIYGDEDEQRSALLIMRCLSVLPLTFRPQQWAGPLSRELLTFNSFVRAVSKSMRQLLEAIGVHMILSGDARRNRDDYLDLIPSLPFQGDVNTGFGILAKTYLDAALFHLGEPITAENGASEAAMAAKSEALNFIDSSFSSVRNPRQEIERGFRFWDTVMIAVRTLVKEQPSSPVPIVAANVAEEFEKADRWLQPMRM